MNTTPRFLITIDTEGDNLWSQPRQITTRNAQFLPRFQTLCEKFNFLPTYLTNYEMAQCEDYRSFARDVLARGTAEIGMHLHAWHSPPDYSLTPDDYRYTPFLIEYPAAVMRDKIAFMTDLLQDTFGVKMRSHRAGRWSFNATYAKFLVEQGYVVDCSVTPHVSWRDNLGDPAQKGGTDFSKFPTQPYFLDLGNISRAGNSPLLEVPMTIVQNQTPLSSAARQLPAGSLPRRIANKLFNSEPQWLRPTGNNLPQMLAIVERAQRENWPYLEWMLHSSEFMPGGSPTFADERAIDKLYEDLEILFARIAQHFSGATLTRFHDEWTSQNQS